LDSIIDFTRAFHFRLFTRKIIAETQLVVAQLTGPNHLSPSSCEALMRA